MSCTEYIAHCSYLIVFICVYPGYHMVTSGYATYRQHERRHARLRQLSKYIVFLYGPLKLTVTVAMDEDDGIILVYVGYCHKFCRNQKAQSIKSLFTKRTILVKRLRDGIVTPSVHWPARACVFVDGFQRAGHRIEMASGSYDGPPS